MYVVKSMWSIRYLSDVGESVNIMLVVVSCHSMPRSGFERGHLTVSLTHEGWGPKEWNVNTKRFKGVIAARVSGHQTTHVTTKDSTFMYA